MLDQQTIIDKYSVADYRLFYAVDAVPPEPSEDRDKSHAEATAAGSPSLCYCLETAEARLLEDRYGRLLTFQTLADAHTVHRMAGLSTPILAFFDTPLPTSEPGSEQEPEPIAEQDPAVDIAAPMDAPAETEIPVEIPDDALSALMDDMESAL